MRHSEKFEVYREWIFNNTKYDKLLFREYYKMGALERKDIEMKREYSRGKLAGLWLAGVMTVQEKRLFERYIKRAYDRMIDIYIA